MKIAFTKHALTRINERGLAPSDVRRAVVSPDKLEVSKMVPSRFLAKKIYYNKESEKEHLLMVVLEKRASGVEIITIIDTSKISKYF